MPIRSEWSLLDKITERIRSTLPDRQGDIVTGIGDDCAVYRLGPDRYGLFSTDMSIESVHFIAGKSSPRDIGYKAMTGNISDISAMGGDCRLALVALGVPANHNEDFILALYDGMLEAASLAGLSISGGDISRSEKLVLSVSIYGETSGYEPVRRNGARTGDTVYVTGNPGGSRAGLEIILDANPTEGDVWKELRACHDRPPVRSGMVRALLEQFRPTAMIDISDGLLSDLGHIAVESRRGFLLTADSFPCHHLLESYCSPKGTDPEDYFLRSGEEYELLFTSPVGPGNGPAEIQGVPVTAIGAITDKEYYIERRGNKIPVIPAGFDHFKS